MADLPDDLLSSKTSLHSIKQFWTAASPCLRSGSTINQAIVRRPIFQVRRGSCALSQGNCALILQVMVQVYIPARFLDS
ncbi:hypothetical protein HanXRQr2_Chr17g0828791 [Helianthus annuus]|uniref:Uncharacterized protein n=1 Tax=Helianthus annuus TaxID=4232 RepID=A0A9K3GW54_HELAN|nr:hypothetical protein HanXRQr2_Chr17g0828791 [Helianthus annuus]